MKAALARDWARSAVGGLRERRSFSDVGAFCLFLGSGRSGHSLLGSLLDAHRQMIVAHQLDVLGYLDAGFGRLQLHHLLLDNSRSQAREGRTETGYSYEVPGQWQGRFETLRVIGDKAGLASINHLRSKPGLIDRLRDTVGVQLRVVHAMRNPYDNIATVAKRREVDLDEAVRSYFSRCRVVERTLPSLAAGEVMHVRHEQFIEDPRAELRQLCAFLGVDAPADYLDACAGIVYDSPHRSRDEAGWSAAQVERIGAEIEAFPFLAGYSFEH